MLQYICCFRDLILLWDPQQIEWKAFYLVPLNHKHSILTSNPNNIYGLTMLSFAFYEHFLLENFLWCIKINKSSRSITWAKTVKRLCKMDQKFLFELGFFLYFSLSNCIKEMLSTFFVWITNCNSLFKSHLPELERWVRVRNNFSTKTIRKENFELE